uniref:Uncharacterized protein n=1 Tax=Setaria italica TaxID=4555 RepID=K4ANW5_SETIT
MRCTECTRRGQRKPLPYTPHTHLDQGLQTHHNKLTSRS